MRFHPSYHLARVYPLPLNMGYLLKVVSVPCSCCSSTYHLAGTSLPLEVAYLLKVTPALRSLRSTGVGCLSLLQGIFPTQGIKPRSPTLQADSLPGEPQCTSLYSFTPSLCSVLDFLKQLSPLIIKSLVLNLK